MTHTVRQSYIAQYLKDKAPQTSREIADALGVACTANRVNCALKRMEAAGIVGRTPDGKRWKLLKPEYAGRCRPHTSQMSRDGFLFAVYWRDALSGAFTGVLQPSLDSAKAAAEAAEPNAWKGIVRIRSVEVRI